MGLSIHYKGAFNPQASLAEMIEEIKDIAEVNSWKHYIFESEFPPNSFGKDDFINEIYGIILTPPGCEPVYFSFASNGRMTSPFTLEHYFKDGAGEVPKYFYMQSTKTQYAGLQTHKIIIDLFRYIHGKYFSAFELHDEGGYWETGDVNILTESFKRYTDLIDSVALALETIKPKKNDSIEKHFERIFKAVQKNRKKKS